ncbi:MAG TPA: 1,4-alpha-glucan branching enzyme, partial [Citricoccus sp.]
MTAPQAAGPNTARSFPELLAAWLPGQRWFPLTGEFELRRAGGIRLTATTEDVQLQLQVVSAGQGEDAVTLSVPVAVRRDPLEDGEAALIGRWDTGDGPRWVYDGTHDPEFVAAWLEMMRRERPTADQRSGGHAYAGFGQWPAFHADTLRARLLQGEQSNTSVVIEAEPGTLILKFFRVLAAGANPDVEIGLALSAAGSSEVPVTYGSVTVGWRPGVEPGAQQWVSGQACVLREFITGSRDAWRVATEAARAGGDFLAEARGIGEATGRLHLALAESLGTRPATEEAGQVPQVLSELASRIEWGWREASAVVGEHLEDRLGHIVTALRAPRAAAGLPPLQRIHADYHLGQVLASGTGDATRWTVLDFEGEPLREAEARSGWDLPLRDVVGMLRSFDYAGALEGSPEWTAGTQRAFLDGYGRTVGEPVDTSSMIFTALLLDKALYETVYELRHRPDWVEVPAAAVRRALEREAAGPAGVAEAPATDTVETVIERDPREDTMHDEQDRNTDHGVTTPSAGAAAATAAGAGERPAAGTGG